MERFRQLVRLLFAKEYSLIIGREKIISFYTQWLKASELERDKLLEIKKELVKCSNDIVYLNGQTYTSSSGQSIVLNSSRFRGNISGALTEI